MLFCCRFFHCNHHLCCCYVATSTCSLASLVLAFNASVRLFVVTSVDFFISSYVSFYLSVSFVRKWRIITLSGGDFSRPASAFSDEVLQRQLEDNNATGMSRVLNMWRNRLFCQGVSSVNIHKIKPKFLNQIKEWRKKSATEVWVMFI